MTFPQVDAQQDITSGLSESKDATTGSNVNANTAPRKRRKRAPAPGAAADCFTCSTRNVKCDRRRPYCSQCLNAGQDCAGYKTQLTWGNGVASRGKLRGLSLPVAGAQKLATPTSPAKTKRRPSHMHLPPSHFKGASIACPDDGAAPSLSVLRPDSATTVGHAAFPFGQSSHTRSDSVPYVSTAMSWPPSTASEGLKMEPADASYLTASSTTLVSPLDGFTFGGGLTPQVGGYSAIDQVSPSSYSATSPESAYFGRVMSHGSVGVPTGLPAYPVSPQLTSPYETPFPDAGQFPFQQGLDESYLHHDQYAQSLPLQHLDPVLDQHIAQSVDEEVEEMPRDKYDDESAMIEEDCAVGFPNMTLNYSLTVSPFAGVGAVGKTPRMQYLINYYTEVISPVIVAFDGPSNPYRTQILRLAAKSETLQHAISALAASNLRQRRETGVLSTGKTDPARRSSMAHLTLTNDSWQHSGPLNPQEQAREEALHKGIAVQSLNRQLADPVLRKDDSILATLLILCLFHICDSGVAKFQTQFAGVKKLLSLRKHDLGLNTKEGKWFTRMFTWFDAMTATVNDREGQLQGEHVEVSALSDEEWALENLAGCDGQLFKTIAQLGRLNVLSQGKSVEDNSTIVSRPPPQVPLGPCLDYNSFDGNGWMRIVEDESLFSRKTDESDVQTRFWREWRDIRHALQTWRLGTTMFDSSSPEAPYLSFDQRIDLANISESFRYAALLYTERLANPNVPSTDPCIRSWVQKCLVFIKAVKSDVYLLWPLFITGSECVDDLDRAVIRERCLDIQKDSGFLNNKSCLELLEKVWERNDKKGMASSEPRFEEKPESPIQMDDDSGFRFTTIMRLENNEGEYIVV